MEAHRRLLREHSRERAEPAERERRRVFVELADRCGHLGFDVPRSRTRGAREDTARRLRPADPLEADAVQEQLLDAATCGPRAERPELAGGRQPGDLGRSRERRDERRQSAWELRMQEVPGHDCVWRVRLGVERRPPRRDRVATIRPQARES